MKKVVLLVASCLLALGVAQLARGAVSFNDPTGDSGTAPDISVVTAGNDAAENLTFTVRTNQAALAADAVVFLVFDIDQNTQTGSNGVEAFLVVASDGWEFQRWNGSQFATAAAPSANASYANGVLTFRISKADLGGAQRFTFWADTAQFDASNNIIAEDTAPDGEDAYEYAITKPLTLRAGATTSVPAKPASGKAFAVRTRITRGDTGGPLASGTVACTVRLGTAPVRATGKISGGVAVCSMKIPAKAKGKLLRVTTKVTFRGVSTTKTTTHRVV